MPLEFGGDTKRCYKTGPIPSLEGFTEFFICAWVYRTGEMPSNWGRIFSKDDANTSDDYALNCDTNEQPGGRIVTSGSGTVTKSSDTALALNTWEWVAAAWDGSQFRFYHNAVQKGSGAATGTIQDSNSALAIGSTNANPTDRGFVGYINDLRIYNIDFPSQSYRDAIYNGKGHDGITYGLVSRWLMNEAHPGATASGAGSIIDCGPSGNHLTPNGSPIYKPSALSPRKLVLV